MLEKILKLNEFEMSEKLKAKITKIMHATYSGKEVKYDELIELLDLAREEGLLE